MAEHPGLLNALAEMSQDTTPGGEGEKIKTAVVRCIEKMALDVDSRPLLARHEGIMIALTKASYEVSVEGSGVQVALKNLMKSL